MSREDSYFKKFDQIFKSVEIGEEELKAITKSYNYFFEIADKKAPQEFIQIIDSFFTSKENLSGKIDFTEAEKLINKENKSQKDSEKMDKLIVQFSFLMGRYKDMTDAQIYKYFMDRHNETEKYGANIDKIPGYNSKTYWNMLIDDYQRVFEMDRKVLMRLVCIDKIITDKPYNQKNIFKAPAYELINDLKNSNINQYNKSGAKWDLIVFPLDRQIRNAVSHLNFYYDDKIHLFLGKDNKGKVFIMFPQIIKKCLLPTAINVVRGFIAASLLFKLKSNEELYKRALEILN